MLIGLAYITLEYPSMLTLSMLKAKYMTSRRNFLQVSSLTLPLLASSSLSCATKSGAEFPIVVATWDSGVSVAEAAWETIQKEGALDAVEAGARHIEEEISCCVGLGGNPDRDGIVTLDACIMDHQHNCGGVAGLERIKHPITVARQVMEDTPHVFLVGQGAQQFALQQGHPLESGKLSPSAQETYDKWLKDSNYKPVINIEQTQLQHAPPPKKLPNGDDNHDTMGLIAIDRQGRLAGACTTSGMAFKMRGRVGDSPIIGAGLYVDPLAGAAVATGQGEEVIRTAGCHLITELMRMGKTPNEACKMAVERIVEINPEKAKDFQVAFIALSTSGEVGSYCIQSGFSYAVRSGGGNQLIEASHLL